MASEEKLLHKNFKLCLPGLKRCLQCELNACFQCKIGYYEMKLKKMLAKQLPYFINFHLK